MISKVRLGLLGCSAVAEYAVIAPAREDTGIEIVAAASRNPMRAGDYAKRNGIGRVVTYEALLDDPEVDAIYIGLPNSMHCEWSIKALQAGKHVICEKPLASNAREAQLMVDAANRQNKVLVEAFHWRYHPLAIRLKELVSSGVLGSLRSVEVQFLIPRAMVPESNIRWDYKLGGGSTMDAGCYCINFLRYLLGEPVAISQVKAGLASELVDSAMRAQMTFSAGVTGAFSCSHIHDGSDLLIHAEITGARGQLKVRNPFATHLGCSLALQADGKSSMEFESSVPTYYYQAREFARVIREGIATQTPAADGALNMQVVDDIYRSAGLPLRGGEYEPDVFPGLDL